MPTTVYNPVLPYAFQVSGGGWTSPLGFSRVTGLGGEIGVLEWRELTDPGTAIKLPTEIAFSAVVLERGVDPDEGLWSWWKEVADATSKGSQSFTRKTLLITAFSKARQKTREWEVYAAWPQAVRWGDLDAMSSGILVESLVLANEGVRVK